MDDKKIENLYELIKYAGYPTGLIINFNNKQIPVEEYNNEELKKIPVGKYYFIYHPSDADHGRDPLFELAIWTDDDPDWVLAQWNEYKEFLSDCYWGWCNESWVYEEYITDEPVYIHEYDEKLAESLVDLTNWANENGYIRSYATNLGEFSGK